MRFQYLLLRHLALLSASHFQVDRALKHAHSSQHYLFVLFPLWPSLAHGCSLIIFEKPENVRRGT